MFYEYYSKLKVQGKRIDLLNEVRRMKQDYKRLLTFRPLSKKLITVKI